MRPPAQPPAIDSGTIATKKPTGGSTPRSPAAEQRQPVHDDLREVREDLSRRLGRDDLVAREAGAHEEDVEQRTGRAGREVGSRSPRARTTKA